MTVWRAATVVALLLVSTAAWGTATQVSTCRDLVILELGDEDYRPGNLFDLEGKTIRFSPDGSGYRAETVLLAWDADFGQRVHGFPSIRVTLRGFRFPFSGSEWDTLYVNNYGSISFGDDQDAYYDPGRDRGLRFREFGGSMANTVPVISPMFRRLGGAFGFPIDPDGVNRIHFKELADRAVVTWIISEPYLDVFSFTTEPRPNRFQTVLHADGTVELSYDEMAVEDGITGLFTLATDETPFRTVSDGIQPWLPAHVDVRRVSLSVVGTSAIRATFETRGPILPEGDPRIEGLYYRFWFDLERPFLRGVDFDDPEFTWEIGGTPDLKYVAFGPGVSPRVEIDGNKISLTATPEALSGVPQFAFFTDAVDFVDPSFPVDVTAAAVSSLPALPSAVVDLSASTGRDTPRQVMYEAFHYPDIAGQEMRLACRVIETLGDEFDFFSFQTDFRLDRQEAGSPSTGAIGDSVSGVIGTGSYPEDYCSDGRIQAARAVQYVGAPIAAPEGVDGSGAFDRYDRQLWHLGHELGHRWLTTQWANVGGQPVRIGDFGPHWLFSLHAPVAFPIHESVEASIMGGGYWQDNGDGTFTLRNQDFAHAAGYSYLDLYLMGLLPRESVPDFFLLRNERFRGYDGDGNSVWSGDRLDISVEDEIAAEGPRLPAFEHSQKEFNIGFVGIVEPGAEPSPMLLERVGGLRQEWMDFWSRATGGISTMTSIAAPNEAPVARCEDVQVLADEQISAEANVDAGSADPDCGSITVAPYPAGPYGLGSTEVTLTVTDDRGASDTCAATVTVVDVSAPSGRIVAPEEASCHGGTVTLADDFADNCDADLERTYAPSGPTVEEHGDHRRTLTVRDDSGNEAQDSVGFTVDTVPPTVRILDWQGGLALPATLPLSLLFETHDDDGATGAVVHEAIKIAGCTIAEGLLSGDTLRIGLEELCRMADHCGWSELRRPEIRVEATDCGGNVGFASRTLDGVLLIRPGVCAR